MIKPTKAYVDSKGNAHAELQSAQIAEIGFIIAGQGDSIPHLAELIVSRAEEVIDILTTSPNARPSARRINGGKKPRKAKVVVSEMPDSTAA